MDRNGQPRRTSLPQSHWDVLGLPKGGSPRQIEEAFAARAAERRRSADAPDLADLRAARAAALRETGDFTG